MSGIRFLSIRLVTEPHDEMCHWTVFLVCSRFSSLNKFFKKIIPKHTVILFYIH